MNYTHDSTSGIIYIIFRFLPLSLTTAIARLLAKPFVSTVIVGASKLYQLEDNLKAADIVLTDEEVKELDELTAPKMLYPSSFYGLMDPVLREAGRRGR